MKKTIASLENTIAQLEHKLNEKQSEIIELEQLLPEFEKKLSFKRGGNIKERLAHVLNEFESVSTNSVWKTKDFIEDVKTQFKALELVVEGISNEGYNHSMKRVIANHVINLLRDMVQRINEINFNYSSRIYDRFDFFRSHTPERRLFEKYRELKQELAQFKNQTENKEETEKFPF